MLSKSFTATSEGTREAKNALKAKGWKQTDLLRHLELVMDTPPSRGTVSKFFNGHPVDREIFKKLCEILELDPWQEVAGLLHPQLEIDALVQEIREKCRGYIQQQCGIMRVLDMPQPIKVNSIYIDVDLLNKPYGYTWSNIEQPPVKPSISSFDYFEDFKVNKTRLERRSGLEIAQEHDKLLILGRPGSGKTTFLKHLAICCNLSLYKAKDELSRVAIFVSLKEYSENLESAHLQDFIQQKWLSCGVKDPGSVENVLDSGRGLILLDGLDEANHNKQDYVLQEIKYFSTRFYKNHIVITCRTAANEYRLEQFTTVEIADFDNKQIQDFSRRWFNKEPEKAELFWRKIQECKRIKELAQSPLLLILLCLIFEDLNDFPESRSQLYKVGVELLLKRWDEQRNILRSEIYKGLSLQKKLDLLSYIAFNSFKDSQYLFKQSLVEKYITEYLTSSIPDVDSRAVLKTIEAQHGLLIERSREVYSFSHLTFQEYFTARRCAMSAKGLQYLATHITEENWREVFILTIDILTETEQLILFEEMKDNLLQVLHQDESLKKILNRLKSLCSGMDFRRLLSEILDSAPTTDAVFYSRMTTVVNGAATAIDGVKSLAAKGTGKVFKATMALSPEDRRFNLDRQVGKELMPANWQRLLTQLQKISSKFNAQQWDHLRKYYRSARILMDCLNSSNISDAAKKQISDAAYLPSSCTPEGEHKLQGSD